MFTLTDHNDRYVRQIPLMFEKLEYIVSDLVFLILIIIIIKTF